VLKIGLSLKPNHHREISLAQIHEASVAKYFDPYNSVAMGIIKNRHLYDHEI